MNTGGLLEAESIGGRMEPSVQAFTALGGSSLMLRGDKFNFSIV